MDDEDKVLVECLSFQAELICEGTKTTEVRSFTLKSQPSTFLDIKRAIEKEFSIPVCVQRLSHQSCVVMDLDNPVLSYVRSGDTFTVCYPSRGDCVRVVKVIEWLKRLVNAISHRLQYGAVVSKEYHTLLSMEYADVSKDFCLCLIYPWTDQTKYVNKLHFDSLGGVELALNLYKSLETARQKNVALFRRDYLEIHCALFVANFTQTFPLRRRIIQHGGLELSIETFLWTPITSNLVSKPYASEAIEVSLYAICK